MSARPEVAHFTLAPDWICEVLSPSTARLDRALKLPRYARAEVEHAWLLDPAARTLEVFRLENGRWTLLGVHADRAVVRAEPFEELELDLAWIWGEGWEAGEGEDSDKTG